MEQINKNDNIKHKCFTNNILLCSPILLSKNNKLIGIHTKENNDQGKILLSPIKQFLIKYNQEFDKKENNLINEIKLEENNLNDDNKNYLIIEYYISKYNIIKIFSEQFVKNNKDKCKIIHEEQTYDLSSTFKLTKKEKFLKIILEENEIGKISDMSYMFYGCDSLKSINVINWNTKYVTNMSNIFSECKLLNSIEGISNWKTDEVINMSNMFYGCISLNPFPDISKWNTKKVKDISKMFSGCKSLPDLSEWNLSYVENMSNLFSRNSHLIKIPFLSKWGNDSNNLSNVTNMSYLFNECTQLQKISGLEKWGTSKVKNMSNLFSGCVNLISKPDISNWDTSSVYDMSNLFNNCINVKFLPNISKWDISQVQNISDIFSIIVLIY